MAQKYNLTMMEKSRQTGVVPTSVKPLQKGVSWSSEKFEPTMLAKVKSIQKPEETELKLDSTSASDGSIIEIGGKYYSNEWWGGLSQETREGIIEKGSVAEYYNEKYFKIGDDIIEKEWYESLPTEYKKVVDGGGLDAFNEYVELQEKINESKSSSEKYASEIKMVELTRKEPMEHELAYVESTSSSINSGTVPMRIKAPLKIKKTKVASKPPSGIYGMQF